MEDNNSSKVLVFSFFVGTIEYVREELQKRGVKALAIHGGIKVDERQKRIDLFEIDPTIRVLISSDVGSEGLDFQFCDTLFNYDLPWNPMKVEQRIGRIDRFGQESDRIRIYNLVIEDSIESRILMRLYNRIEIFKQSIGDIEVILGEYIREITQAVFTNRLSPDEEIERAEQAAINIIRQKQEMEDFEQKRLQFLGQEAIFSTAIERTIEMGRFVSDVEVHALVQLYLKEKCPLSRLHANEEDATYVLYANDDLVKEISTFIYGQRKNDLSSQQFLKKLSPGKEIPLTFSHELAFHRKLLEFITPRHPLALAAQEHLKKKNEGKKMRAHLRLNTNIAPAGIYYFFIYALDLQGIDADSRLASVVLPANAGEVHEELSKQFLRLLQTHALPTQAFGFKLNETLFSNADDKTFEYMAKVRDEQHEELLASNEALVNARVSAVQQTYNAKAKRIKSTLEKVSNPNIRRMYESQLRNLAAKKRAREKEIEQGRKVNASISLVLSGWVEVTNNP